MARINPIPLPSETPKEIQDAVRRLTDGSMRMWTSGWRAIEAGEQLSLDHDLGEIPFQVDAQASRDQYGAAPFDGNASATITKNRETISVTNTSSERLFFFVRAI